MQIVVVEDHVNLLVKDAVNSVVPGESGNMLPAPISMSPKDALSLKAPIPTTSDTIFALSAYCFSSIGMTVLNKFVLSSHRFKLPFLLLSVQSCVCVCFLIACKQSGVLTYRPLTRKEAIEWFPVSCLLILMIYTGSLSLKYLTVAMFTVFKNVSIIFTAFVERQWFGNQVTPLMVVSFILIVPWLHLFLLTLNCKYISRCLAR